MKPIPTLIGSACAFAMAASASAQVLMLDFGPTTSTGTDRLVSPYHTATPSFTQTTWNTIGTGDLLTGAVWSDGTSATGVSINLGGNTSPGTVVGLATVPSGSTLTGTTITSGVYAGTSPGRDGIFTGTTGQDRAIGVQVGGLSAGTYDIYITGRNTNTSAATVQNFFIGTSASAGDFDFAAFSTKSLSFGNTVTSATANWTENANYVKFSVTLTSGQFLDIAARGGTGETRGFLNAIQIVNTASPVPEPSAFAFLAGLVSLGGTIFLRRRVRSA